MSCQICGRSSAPGAKLCPDCRAARKRAFDATITQPLLAMAGAGTVSRTLSRLRRSDSSPEAKARRAARKAKAANDAAPPAAVAQAAPQAAAPSRVSRSILWAGLAIGVVVAAIAGWHLPTHAPEAPDAGASSSAAPALPSPPAPAAESARIDPPAVSAPQPLPTIVERELVPHAPAVLKPGTPKRATPAPKVVAAPPPQAPAEVEIVKPPPAPAPPAPKPQVRIDPWQQMSEAIARCPAEFLGRVVCEQKVRLQYCEGQWGKVPQCPGGPSADHN
jgi:hypothetical protein